MEVIAAATTVCSLCMSIEQWIDQLSQREELFSQISSSVVQIHRILKPFSTTFRGTSEVELSQAIRAVGDTLQRTKEHLVVWKYKKSQRIMGFINPGAQIQKLKDDQMHISNQLIILLTSFAAVGYFRDHAKDQEAARSLSELTESLSISEKNLVPLDELREEDVKTFWKDFIGAKVNFVTIDVFGTRLQSWYEGFNGLIPKWTSDRIIMRLDEFNCGGITPYNLERALDGGTLKQFVDRYVRGDETITISKPGMKIMSSHGLRTPLLVWIDDCPENIAYEVGKAEKLGIMVIQLSSTAIAKAWVEENLAFIRANDNPSRLRFVSDNVRLESTPGETGPYLNHTAGQNFLQYIRARFIEAPVLIYTSRVDTTAYVNSFKSAGSTTKDTICLRYITSLAAGELADNVWMGLDGKMLSTQV